MRDLTATEAAKRIRGQPGTPVTLTIMREDEDGPIEFTIIRDIVEIASVKSELVEPGFARIRISRFQTQTGARLLEEIRRAEEANDGPLSGAVLDLRNNPGGILSGAVSVADAFLDDGSSSTPRDGTPSRARSTTRSPPTSWPASPSSPSSTAGPPPRPRSSPAPSRIAGGR